MAHSKRITNSLLLLLAVASQSACRRTSEAAPAAAVAAPAPQVTAAPPEDEGEVKAGVAGAHRIGTPGPALQLKTLDGAIIDLAKVYGTKPVYLKLWATWCVPCREQMPKFERIYQTYGDRLEVIAVNAGLDDSPAAVRAFGAKHGLHMPIVVDNGRLAAALDLQVTPQHVIIGRDGRIAYVGHLDGEKLDAAIEQALAAPSAREVVRGAPVLLPPAYRPGDVVRGIRLKLVDGRAIELGTARRPQAVVLFADWCESYLEETQPATSQACRRVRETVDRLATRGDVEWIGIATNVWSSAKSVADYQADTKTKLPIAFDESGELFRAFGVRAMPTIVLLDKTGRVSRVLGPNDRDLDGAVRSLRRRS